MMPPGNVLNLTMCGRYMLNMLLAHTATYK
jgi:hypothetical protein